VLSRGSYALVDEVECLTPSDKGRAFARKVLTVSRRQRLDEIMKEPYITKSLHHFHAIEVKSTYEEMPKTENGKKSFGIIIDPVADCTLKDYLEMLDGRTGSLQGNECINLETWFGCLASGLAFVHAQRIKHKDIKPANILLKGNLLVMSGQVQRNSSLDRPYRQ
jgi:serine/threonine protein kinase